MLLKIRILEFQDDCRYGCGVTVHRRDEEGHFRCSWCNEPHELRKEIDNFEREVS